MNRYGIGMGAATAVVGTLALAGTAQAATLQDLIPNEAGTNVLGSDENREMLINRVGDENIIDVGDSIYGVFSIPQLFVSRNGSVEESALMHQAGNSELTGEFQLRVVSKERIEGTDRFRFTFGVDEDFQEGDNGGNDIVRLYEDDLGDDPTTTYFNNLDDSIALAIDVTTDDELWLAAGLVSDSNYWSGEGLEDVTLTGPSGFRIGESIFALDKTGGSMDYMLGNIQQGEGSGQLVGTSNIGPGLEGSAWPLSSNTNFNFRVVPTPAAVGPGLALLTLALARRRRKA